MRTHVCFPDTFKPLVSRVYSSSQGWLWTARSMFSDAAPRFDLPEREPGEITRCSGTWVKQKTRHGVFTRRRSDTQASHDVLLHTQTLFSTQYFISYGFLILRVWPKAYCPYQPASFGACNWSSISTLATRWASFTDISNRSSRSLTCTSAPHQKATGGRDTRRPAPSEPHSRKDLERSTDMN